LWLPCRGGCGRKQAELLPLTAMEVLFVPRPLHSWSGYIANIYHRQLLNAAMTTLAFIGIRVVYSLATICTQNPALNPISGSLAARVVLSFLPEIISTLLLVVAGILTRNVRRISKRTKADK